MPADSVSLNNVTGVNVTDVKQDKRVNTFPKTKPYLNDTVELSTKIKKKPGTKESLLAVAAGLAGAGVFVTTAAVLFAKHQGNKISKLYKERLVLSNLPENIEFKEAKNVQEGIDFAKKILGVKEVDKEFTLEAINIANKGLVDVSNANKGKLFIPTRLGFEKLEGEDGGSTLAYVVNNINSPKFGNLVINKDFFNKDILNKKIKELLYTGKEKCYGFNKKGELDTVAVRVGMYRPVPKGDVAELIKKYYKDKSKLTINEQRTLFYSLEYGYTSALRSYRNPMEALKILEKEGKKDLKANNWEINFEEIEKLPTKKQTEYLKDLITKLENKGFHIEYPFGLESPATTIYHEMGHLQDFAKNLKELDVKQWKFSLKDVWKESKHKVETGEDISRIGVNEVDNRWGCVWNDSYSKLLKENPEKFKKMYPDLYEFVTNEEIQRTAGKVSSYAQSGIGEFLAEVYKKKIAKQNIPDDVEALYKRYNGPELAV